MLLYVIFVHLNIQYHCPLCNLFFNSVVTSNTYELNQVLFNSEVLGEHIIWSWTEVASLEQKNQKSWCLTLLWQSEWITSFFLVFVSSSVKCSISQARLGYATVTKDHQKAVILSGSHWKTQASGGHISVPSGFL